MGKQKDISADEKVAIRALHDAGLSLRQIKEHVHRSLGAIHNCVKNYREGIETVRPGRQSEVSNRQMWDRRWRKIIFSDEKKFNLDGPDGNCFYYHDKRKKQLLHDRRHTGGGGVMVWGAIGWNGKTDLAFLEGNQNSTGYLNTLQHHLLPDAARIGGRNWIFQQDNAPIHVSRQSMAWFEERGIRLLPWPARSPDLNPMENVWAIMSRMVYKDGKQYANQEDLKTAIATAWANISGRLRQTLISSMPRRLNTVIGIHGYVSSY